MQEFAINLARIWHETDIESLGDRMPKASSTRSPKSGGNSKGKKAGFGSIRKLPSGRRQARYTGPDGQNHNAPTTFDTLADARAWLALRQSEVTLRKWKVPTKENLVTFENYAQIWLKNRDLKPRTRFDYSKILENHLNPHFGKSRPADITPDFIRAWYADFNSDTPTQRAHCYSLLRTILATAVEDALLAANPCHIRGAGNVKRAHKVKPATLDELDAIVTEMPERFKVMTLLAAWCAMRFGELVELRRKDIDLDAGVIHVRRGSTRVAGEIVIGTPKSTAGSRDVAIPPHLLPAIQMHINALATDDDEQLLFPNKSGGTLHPSALYGSVECVDPDGRHHVSWGFYKAREIAGRPDLRWHDLRHTGAVLAASTGATLAELMGRLGHSSPAAALRYQHVAKGRDQVIANALSKLAEK